MWRHLDLDRKWRNWKSFNEKYLRVVPCDSKKHSIKVKEGLVISEAFSRLLWFFCFIHKRRKKYFVLEKSTQSFQRLIEILFENSQTKKFLSSAVPFQNVMYFALQLCITAELWGTQETMGLPNHQSQTAIARHVTLKPLFQCIFT